MSNLFDSLVRYGDVFSLNDTLDYPKFHEGLHKFDDKWVKYNEIILGSDGKVLNPF